jgi:O-antigen chain-terminating methyltransferase
MSADFYRAFEDRHRGARADIAQRHRVFLPFLAALRDLAVPQKLVDVGCGRGEWLELARTEGWQVEGVDSDEGMLAECRKAGLDVRKGDALEHLRGLGDASAGVVSAFHVVEHLPFETLRAVVGEALRVLAPGGLLVLETPNPENLVVGSSGFYMDPTHARPLPPLLLAFVAEFAGFTRVTTLRLHEGVMHDRPAALIDVLAGVSPDYAIVAQKPGPASPALDAALAAKHGVNLNELAERWERGWQDRVRELHVSAGVAHQGMINLSLRVAALERAVATKDALEKPAAEKVMVLQEHLRAVQASTSWRVTAPMRWAIEKARQLRTNGVRRTVRGAARAVAIEMPRAVNRVLLERAPRLRAGITATARALGLGFVIRRIAPPQPPPPPPPPPLDLGTLSSDALRAFETLRHAAGLDAPGKDR